MITGDLLGPLQQEWTRFASELPAAARILDLACGAGTVGQSLIACRDDISVVGVDWAQIPAQSQPALTLMPSVRMEALPFDCGSFDAAVSQFGIEYGDIGETAPQLARVLKADSLLCCLVHHHDSQIARDGRMRHEALRALNSRRVRDAFLSGDRRRLHCEFDELSRRYPRECSVGPSLTYFERRIGGTPAQRDQAVANFDDLITPDISLLRQLEQSCPAADRLDRWLEPLSRLFEIDVSVVRSKSGEPIAWKVFGRRESR